MASRQSATGSVDALGDQRDLGDLYIGKEVLNGGGAAQGDDDLLACIVPSDEALCVS